MICGLPLYPLLKFASQSLGAVIGEKGAAQLVKNSMGTAEAFSSHARDAKKDIQKYADNTLKPAVNDIVELSAFYDLLPFFLDRLKVAQKEKGIRHDLIDAVFSLGGEDDLVRLVARVDALQSFIASDNGTNLLAAYKRAANILKAEEKKDKRGFGGEVDTTRLALPEEKELFVDLKSAGQSCGPRSPSSALPRRCTRWRACANRWMPFSTR